MSKKKPMPKGNALASNKFPAKGKKPHVGEKQVHAAGPGKSKPGPPFPNSR